MGDFDMLEKLDEFKLAYLGKSFTARGKFLRISLETGHAFNLCPSMPSCCVRISLCLQLFATGRTELLQLSVLGTRCVQPSPPFLYLSVKQPSLCLQLHVAAGQLALQSSGANCWR
jgi:hypothetical protein